MLKHFLNPPNWFTAASLFCSTYAIALVAGADEITPHLLSRASVLVIFGGVFDLLDGRVARITKRFSEFGTQLDSIADIVGFGVAPAIIAWAWLLSDLGFVGFLAPFWFVLCAAFRLARFNVESGDADAWDRPGHSRGLSSTMAGGSLVAFVWVANEYLVDVLVVHPFALASVVFALGLLMISSWPMRNFKDLRSDRWSRRYLAVGLGASLVAGLAFHISMWWAVGALTYLGIAAVDGSLLLARERRERTA